MNGLCLNSGIFFNIGIILFSNKYLNPDGFFPTFKNVLELLVTMLKFLSK